MKKPTATDKLTTYMLATARTEEAGPQLIGPIKWAEVRGMIADLRKRIKTLKPTSTFGEANVFDIVDEGDMGYIVLAMPVTNEVLFFINHVRVDPSDIAGVRAGRQIMVWRMRDGKNSEHSLGFADYAFFIILLPRYRTLIADRMQTKYGKEFWLLRIRRAFERRLKVYVLDHQTREHALKKYASPDALMKDTHKIWGTADTFQRIAPVISKVPIALDPKK